MATTLVMDKLFISHASEDKAFVRQLIECLEAMRIDYWFDAHEIDSGDSIPQKINDGLRTTTYGVLILSPNYLREDKVWTWEELWALINIESTSSQRTLIPIRLGLSHLELTHLVPLVAHRLSIDFIDRPQDAAQEISIILSKNNKAVRQLSGENTPRNGLPSRHNIPMPRPAIGSFIGRDLFINSLIDQLVASREQDLSEFGLLALTGIPGFGKSTTACELTYLIGRQFPGGVFWFNASTTVHLRSSIQEVEKLVLPTGEQNSSDNIRRYFENQACLLIIDALDLGGLVLELMPLIPRTGSSRIVITTRSEKLDLPIRTISIPLPDLDLPSASQILMQFRTVRQDDKELQAVANICQELGFLPLAIQLAARYLRSHSLSFSDYLNRLRSRGPTWKGLASTIQTIPSVVEVLKQSVEELNSHRKTGELALKILRRCAIIDLGEGNLYRWDQVDPIFGRQSTSLAASVGIYPSDEDAIEQFDEAIEILEKAGLIRLNAKHGSDVWLHTLTLQFMRDYLNEEDAHYLAFRFYVDWTNTKRMMSRAGWIDYQEMYQSIRGALPIMKKLSTDAALNALRTLYAMADFTDQEEAISIVDETMNLVMALEGSFDNSITLVKLRIDRAYSIYKAKRLREAETLYRQLATDLERIGTHTDYFVDYLYYFGCLLLQLGGVRRKIRASKLWNKAVEMLIEELASMEKEKANIHPYTLFEMKLRLLRLFQAKAEMFSDRPLGEVEAQMARSLLAELEPKLGMEMSWERQFLHARSPLTIKMSARAVRRVPV